MFVGIVLIAALVVTGLQRRTTLSARAPAIDEAEPQPA